ncbi:MAG: hypothetical protein ACOYNS_06335 [Bacteroidota bacterium]
MKISSIIVICVILLPAAVRAQESTARTYLALYGGTGSLAVKDEFISLRKYSGTFSTFGAEWGTKQDSVKNSFGIEYQHGSNVRNNNSGAEVFHMRMIFDHQSFLKKISVFGNDADWYVGPAGIMAMHIRSQQVALKDEMYSDYMSFFLENSIAVSTSVIMPMGGSWVINAGATMDVVTIGLRMIDNTKTEKDQMVKILFPWSNLNGRCDLGVEYRLSDDLSVSGKYMFQFVRNTAWNDLFIAVDNAVVRVSYVW